MKVTFLKAKVPLAKRFTVSEKHPYPNAFEFKSITKEYSTLEELHALMVSHAAAGHCMLKGDLLRDLDWESRAGSTDPHATTYVVCLDVDGFRGAKTADEFMALIGLPATSYILQWSASYGVNGNFEMRCHLIFLLKTPVAAPVLKIWLRQLNLTVDRLRNEIELCKTNCALKWPLDVTTCQNDKLIYIAPPECDPPEINKFTGDRIILIKRSDPVMDFSLVDLKSAEELKLIEQTIINAQRKSKGLPERHANKFTLKEDNGEYYLPNPDHATVTSTKEERGFTYLNLNGGDSFAYYHPTENPKYIYNFKGEPTYLASQLVPDYWASIQRAKKASLAAQHVGKLFLVFRDPKTSAYHNGWYEKEKDILVLNVARNKEQLKDFLANHGQPIIDKIPDWTVIYDPSLPTIDLPNKTVNTFQKSFWMKWAEDNLNTYVKKSKCEKIMALIRHVVGIEMTPYFINWLAFCFKYRIAPGTAWIWHGVQGTGKGVLLNHIIAPLFGAPNVSIKRMEELEDRFNAHLEHSLINFVDEAQISESGRNKIIMSNIKNQITEPNITIRRMREQAYQVKNHVGWIFASNMPDPVTVESSDRRFYVGDYQPQRLMITDDDIKELTDELADFAHMLQSYEVDKQQVRVPITTETKLQMIMASRPSADTVADAIIHGDLQVLWDALPTVDSSMLDMKTVIKLSNYKQLIHNIIYTKQDRLTRDELHIIFDYNVGNVSGNPWKLTAYLKHHGLQMKDIRMAERTTKGVLVKWKQDEDWFTARKAEILAEAGGAKLKMIKGDKS